MSDLEDAATLRRAAAIMRQRAPKQSFTVRVLIKMLRNTADWIEEHQ